MENRRLKKLILSALFLALGIVLPLLTAQIKEIGDTLLPMHLPVLLCGALCGWHYGGAIGFILPFLRAFLFGMPPLYPNAVWMAAELAAYGAVIGILYAALKKRGILGLYASLIGAMLIGRAVWGVTKAILLGVGGKPFPLAAFFAGGVIDALPGIILQLILIPLIISLANKRASRV